jgi:hypothetical protein
MSATSPTVPLNVVSSSCAVQALRIIQLHREQYSIAIRGDLIVIGLLAIATTADGARLAPECRMGRGPARRLREDGSSASARHKTERICLEPEAIRIRQPVIHLSAMGGNLRITCCLSSPRQGLCRPRWSACRRARARPRALWRCTHFSTPPGRGVVEASATFLPSGPDDTFSDSLYAWKIAKFGYSATAPLRATPLGPA